MASKRKHGTFRYHAPERSSTFHPVGVKVAHGSRRRNPPYERWDTDDSTSARLFVGFNVGPYPRYKLDDLVTLVRDNRVAAGHPMASFVAQRGVYQHEGDGHIVTEDGAQVIIINTYGASLKDFKDEMIELAGYIAHKMQQEEVVVEIQHNGITKGVIGVGWQE